MTTTGEFTTATPPPPAGDGPHRVLRRSRTDRVGAGVAGGLGAYFGVDPVLFRVLFATSAFFGGAGVLAYLLAWAAIPEEGTAHAAIDRWVHELRRRRVPLWAVVIVGGLLVWALAFSWWAPGPFFPVMFVVVVLVVLFARRGTPPQPEPYVGVAAPGFDPAATATLPAPGVAGATGAADRPVWVDESRQWFTEAKQAARERRRRAFPVRIGAVVTLVLTLGVLAFADAVTGIALPVYFWVTLGIVVLALLVGAVLRRTPWSLTLLIVPSVVGIVAFGGTHASLHDGFGQREWTPTTSVASQYRLAFGQGVLDLRHLASGSTERTVDVTMAAGQVRLLVPRTMNVTVEANVRFGEIEVDGTALTTDHGRHSGGVNLQRTIFPPSGASGTPLTINVHLADGQISIERS